MGTDDAPRKGPARKRTRRTKRVDWKKARRLHEQERKSFTEIAELLGCDRNTVARHAKREAWVDAALLLRESSGDRRENLLRSFIEQDSEAIRANLHEKHSILGRILKLAEREVARIESGQALYVQRGVDSEGDPILVEEDRLLSIRRLALTVQTCEVVDRSLADLKGHDWRSGAGAGGADSGADAEAVQAVLDELEEAEPAGR